MIAACTIVSPNYLPFARTLAASYLQHHPGHRFFVLLVADLPANFTLPSPEPFELVPLASIGILGLRFAAMRFDILELNTNVKPAFLQYLFRIHSPTHLTYLDPDILVTAPFDPVFQALDAGNSCALTPHITTPITDPHAPSEQDHLYNGTYNLGFASFRNTPVADQILAWWSDRCLTLGFSEGRTGLFVDQKWMNLAPGLFPEVAILRDPGCNMAYWNLHERSLLPGRDPGQGSPLVQSPTGPAVPLRFFHFSGLDRTDPTILSRNTDRFTLPDRPDLAGLFRTYKEQLQANTNPTTDSIPYGFDTLSDGTYITRLARRLFSKNETRFGGNDPATAPDPFDARGPFAAFARRHRLVAGPARPVKSTWREFNARDRRVEAVHRLLSLSLRLLGPNRYELLMRYLAHIAVLRNQSVFLGRDKSA